MRKLKPFRRSFEWMYVYLYSKKIEISVFSHLSLHRSLRTPLSAFYFISLDRGYLFYILSVKAKLKFFLFSLDFIGRPSKKLTNSFFLYTWAENWTWNGIQVNFIQQSSWRNIRLRWNHINVLNFSHICMMMWLQ